ncbi:MAG: deoxyribonuclease IV [Leptospirales bacterium]
MTAGLSRGKPCTGVHVSIQGGIWTAFDRASALDCRAIQIFTHSSRTWSGANLEEAEIDRFKSMHHSHEVGPVLVHASYLINAATEDPDKREKSRKALLEDWILSNRLGVSGLVLHPGSSVGQSADSALSRASELIREVLDHPVEGATRLLLENTAGGGHTIGRSPEEMERLFKGIGHSKRIGLCLDSCHLLAAGFEIRDEAGYQRTLREFCRVAPDQTVSAWHLNDALFEIGSGKDRHAHIGTGTIGLWFFWKLLKDPRFEGCPMVLETPKSAGDREDRLNLETLTILERQTTFDEDEPSILKAVSELAQGH